MHNKNSAPLLSTMALLSLTVAPATRAPAQELIDIGTLNGGNASSANSVSADGSVVAGEAADGANGNALRAFRWTQAGGMVDLGTLNGGFASSALGMSADGSVVVGQAADGASANAIRAFRWTQAGGMVSLGVLNGGSVSFANGVSADGSVVVGTSRDGSVGDAFRAFRWTQAGGMASLGVLNGGTNSLANGVSADGSVVVGVATDGAANNDFRAFRWTQADGMVSLGVLNGGDASRAYGVSADGSVVVGESADGASANASRAFRWTQTSGMVSLGVLNGGSASVAAGVSADGNVVVGAATDGANANVQRAFRWTQATGMQTVEDWLRAAGATIVQDVTSVARATNQDGSVVVGQTANQTAFIARVPNDNGGGGNGGGGNGGGGPGIITVDDLQESLADAGTGRAVVINAFDLVLNGTGGRPLARRAKPRGKLIAWVSGDGGHDDHGAHDGSLVLGEIGLGYDFGAVQLNGAYGLTALDQDTLLGGRTDVDSRYVKLEALARLHPTPTGGLWAVVTGAGLWGDADIRRHYLDNGGLVDSSAGNPDVEGYGIRGRLQWENLVPHLSPHGEIAYAHACIDRYTESGGAFPAAFDELCDDATEARYGFDAEVPLAQPVRLTATLEGVHRIEEEGANITGQVLGLGAFNVGAADYRQDWVRGGLGLELDVGNSTLAVMANATSEGESANAWIAASLRMTF